MAKIDWYLDFVDLSYKPRKDDLLALFYFEPAKGISIKEAAGRIASESSVGTWTTLTTIPKGLKRLMARAYEIKGNYCKIAYPYDLWEEGSVPQLLSGIAGNIFGMKALRNIRLVDVRFPKRYLRSFKGPEFSIRGVRKFMKVKKRPLVACVPKPKLGIPTNQFIKIARDFWLGGGDLLKDDENLTNQVFNRFKNRFVKAMKTRDKIEKETGEKKSYLVNITAPVKEMEKRLKLVADYGNEYVMVDFLTIGFSAFQYVRELAHDYKLAIHVHRAMHAAMDRNPKHGMTMLFLAKLVRLIGGDQLHIGTVGLGKLEGKKQDVLLYQKTITKKFIREEFPRTLGQDWDKIKPVFPVASGGLHPGLLPRLFSIMGTDIVIQVGGGIHGHPKGTYAGTKAVRQAIDAYLQGIDIREYAKKHKELKQALDKFGFIRPK